MSTEGRELSLLVRVQGQLCALPLASVEEAMRPQPVRAIADAPAFVRGLARIRGGPVPVVDVGVLLDANTHAAAVPSALAPAAIPPAPASPSQGSRFVSLRTTTDRRVALAVDEVLGVRTIGEAQLSDMPPLLARAGGEVVSAIGTLDAELLMVLRTSRLVPDEVWAALDADDAHDPGELA